MASINNYLKTYYYYCCYCYVWSYLELNAIRPDSDCKCRCSHGHMFTVLVSDAEIATRRLHQSEG